MNILDIYRRASQHLPLTPGERAFLRWVDAQILAAVAAGATTIGVAFAQSNGTLTWADVLHALIYSVVTALLLATAKYFRAMGDGPLGVAMAQVANTVEGKGQLSAQEVAQVTATVDAASTTKDASA